MNPLNREVKLIDFGVSKRSLESKASALSTKTVEVRNVMTPQYAAPEVLAEEELGKSVDIYSFAIVM